MTRLHPEHRRALLHLDAAYALVAAQRDRRLAAEAANTAGCTEGERADVTTNLDRSAKNRARCFWAKVEKTDTCWIWQGCQSRGYGRFSVQGKMVGAHRYAYEALVGPIPEGLVIDHLCRNPLCVNPAHLEPVTPRENCLRGETFAARRVAQDECIHGHPLTGENLMHNPNGSRKCRTCHLEIDRTYRREKRAAERLNLA